MPGTATQLLVYLLLTGTGEETPETRKSPACVPRASALARTRGKRSLPLHPRTEEPLWRGHFRIASAPAPLLAKLGDSRVLLRARVASPTWRLVQAAAHLCRSEGPCGMGGSCAEEAEEGRTDLVVLCGPRLGHGVWMPVGAGEGAFVWCWKWTPCKQGAAAWAHQELLLWGLAWEGRNWEVWEIQDCSSRVGRLRACAWRCRWGHRFQISYGGVWLLADPRLPVCCQFSQDT